MMTLCFKKGLAFTITLILVFTTLFGGFGALGINGVVEEAYADPMQRTTTLDLTTGTGVTIDAITAGGWAWDGTSIPMVLTLSGIKLSTASEVGIKVPSGTSIIVTGGNTVMTAKDGNAAQQTYGILCDGNLAITGGGTLTVTGGATNNQNSHGICIQNSEKLTISGGLTLNAFGSSAGTANSYGIYTSYVEINSGTVNFTGTGSGSGNRYGIYATEELIINGGTINATGTGGTGNRYGINATNLTINGGTITATGDNYGITTGTGDFTINGGYINASGADYGIYSYNLTIEGGTVNATGSGASPASRGILVNNATFSINGGTVNATAVSGKAIEASGNSGIINLGASVMITNPSGAGLNRQSDGGGVYTGTYIATTSGGSTAVTSATIAYVAPTPPPTSGGSGSGSGGGGGSAATPVINTNTGNVTDGQLNTAAGAAKHGEAVTIKSSKTNEVTFPVSGLGSLAGKDNSLTIITEKGTLTFDSKAVSSMGTQATAEDIQVIVDNVDKTILTEDQQEKVGDKVVYDLTVISGGNLISSFNGGRVNVSIPYEVKTGQSSDDLTVWYMSDDGNLTEIKCTYDEKTKSVTFVVDHFSKYIIGYADGATWVNPFQDLVSGAWFYEAVAYVNARDLMKGQTETTFAPQAAMTRGMFVTILGRMEGLDTSMYEETNTFSDVDSSQYYSSYIAWASGKGIVSGMGEDKFVPNAYVTREQMAVMMTNYMKYKGQGPVGQWAIQLKYGDLENVSSWAGEGVMFVTMKGLMKGMGNDAAGNPLFAPKLTSNRAQTAQLMMNLQELMK